MQATVASGAGVDNSLVHSACRGGVVRRQLLQHSLFRNIKLVRIGHHGEDFALLADQKLLELSRTHRGIDPDGSLIRYRVVYFGGNRVDNLAAVSVADHPQPSQRHRQRAALPAC